MYSHHNHAQKNTWNPSCRYAWGYYPAENIISVGLSHNTPGRPKDPHPESSGMDPHLSSHQSYMHI